MPKICYVDKMINGERAAMIPVCNQIIAEFTRQGYVATLRQLYYRIVALDLFPDTRKYVWVEGAKKWVKHPKGTKNAEPNYDWLGEIVNDARLAGLIDWNAIEDLTRHSRAHNHWDNPEGILKSASDSYRNDLWRWQPFRPEVWVEKDAVVKYAARACQPLDVPFFSCRGYTSQTAMWEAAQRLLSYRAEKVEYTGPHQRKNGQSFRQRPVIFHLGDHDPSGIDMTRDITDRLTLFCGFDVDVRRIALNMDQIKELNPPPNPAKTTDSRFASYMELYGDESWELDAMPAQFMVDLIDENLRSIMDVERFNEAVDIQEKGRRELQAIEANYNKAVEAIEKKSEHPTSKNKQRKKTRR